MKDETANMIVWLLMLTLGTVAIAAYNLHIIRDDIHAIRQHVAPMTQPAEQGKP